MSTPRPIAARSCEDLTIPKLRSDGGSVVLEMAVALPAFMMLMIGTLQLAIVLLTFCNATLACSQAARYASLHSSTSVSPASTSQIQSFVTSKLFIGKSITPTVNVLYTTASQGAGSNVIGNMVTVSVSWNQSISIPFASKYSFSVGSQDIRVITR